MSAGTALRAALIAALMLPLVPILVWSVARGWFFPDLVPARWSLAPWIAALRPGSDALAAAGESLAVAGAATAIALVVGLPAARALALHRFRGRRAVLALVAAPLLLPGIAVAMGLHPVFLALGLGPGRAGVILVHLVPTLPYMILSLMVVFAAYDIGFEDQARSLGAGPVAAFRHVALPMLLPGILAGAAFAFLVSWGQYLLTLVIGGGRVQTLPLALYSYAAAGRNDLAAVLAVLSVLPGALMLAVAAGRLRGRTAPLR